MRKVFCVCDLSACSTTTPSSLDSIVSPAGFSKLGCRIFRSRACFASLSLLSLF
jgi:hypothetical protein